MPPSEIYFYNEKLSTGAFRSGAHICREGRWAEIAPLPGLSVETLDQAIDQIDQIDQGGVPSASFARESLNLPFPSPKPIETSLLLMGSCEEILNRAALYPYFTSAKLKVSQLPEDKARDLIDKLSTRFYLRVDVNRAWKTEESLKFFKRYPIDLFDYVEEPFQNPKDLPLFTHPLAVDESYPRDLSFQDLEKLPALKAVVYKPMIQGGLVKANPLKAYTDRLGIKFIASSAFETDVGLAHVLAFADRLGLKEPVGIGTYHYLETLFCDDAIRFDGSKALIKPPIPKKYGLL
ncbi:MAG: enolase C-terminal domain-like protein [Parachlamydiaceae bacterium]